MAQWQRFLATVVQFFQIEPFRAFSFSRPVRREGGHSQGGVFVSAWGGGVIVQLALAARVLFPFLRKRPAFLGARERFAITIFFTYNEFVRGHVGSDPPSCSGAGGVLRVRVLPCRTFGRARSYSGEV